MNNSHDSTGESSIQSGFRAMATPLIKAIALAALLAVPAQAQESPGGRELAAEAPALLRGLGENLAAARQRALAGDFQGAQGVFADLSPHEIGSKEWRYDMIRMQSMIAYSLMRHEDGRLARSLGKVVLLQIGLAAREYERDGDAARLEELAIMEARLHENLFHDEDRARQAYEKALGRRPDSVQAARKLEQMARKSEARLESEGKAVRK